MNGRAVLRLGWYAVVAMLVVAVAVPVLLLALAIAPLDGGILLVAGLSGVRWLQREAAIAKDCGSR